MAQLGSACRSGRRGRAGSNPVIRQALSAGLGSFRTCSNSGMPQVSVDSVQMAKYIEATLLREYAGKGRLSFVALGFVFLAAPGQGENLPGGRQRACHARPEGAEAQAIAEPSRKALQYTAVPQPPVAT